MGGAAPTPAPLPAGRVARFAAAATADPDIGPYVSQLTEYLPILGSMFGLKVPSAEQLAGGELEAFAPYLDRIAELWEASA